MPYIITKFSAENWEATRVNDSHGYPSRRRWIDGRAVATLAEVVRALNATGADWTLDGINGENGGTVGPLPDGTVIEVKRVNDAELRAAIPACNTFPRQLHVDGRDLLDAFNAESVG